MKLIHALSRLALHLVVAGVFLSPGGAEPKKIQVKWNGALKAISGVDREGVCWVDLEDVAEVVGCTVRSSSLTGRVVVSRGAHQLAMFEGSRHALLDEGTAVELKSAPALVGGKCHLPAEATPVVFKALLNAAASWDADDRVLVVEPGAGPVGGEPRKEAPARPEAPREVNTIVVDAGHGGRDGGGARGREIIERELTLDLARRTAKLLEDKGFKVILTRGEDVFISLAERAAIANRHKADAFVSIHANWYTNSKASGSEVYIFNFSPSSKQAEELAARENLGVEEGTLRYILRELRKRSEDEPSILLAGSIHEVMRRTLPFRHRQPEILRAPFFVLANTDMPAVLVEVGYLSNAAEAKAFQREETRRRAAQAITEGIVKFKEAQDQRTVAR